MYEGFFFFLGLFLLLIVDSVGVQLLTATYKCCCRIPLSLLQILGLLCCNFRASVFVYPIIDLILVLKFQQVAIVGTNLANFYIWNYKSKWQRQSLVVNWLWFSPFFPIKKKRHTNPYKFGPLWTEKLKWYAKYLCSTHTHHCRYVRNDKQELIAL